MYSQLQSQEESSALALALADKEAALVDGAAALHAARAEVERLLAARLELVSELEEGRQELREALALAADCRKDAAAARELNAAAQAQMLEVGARAWGWAADYRSGCDVRSFETAICLLVCVQAR